MVKPSKLWVGLAFSLSSVSAVGAFTVGAALPAQAAPVPVPISAGLAGYSTDLYGDQFSETYVRSATRLVGPLLVGGVRYLENITAGGAPCTDDRTTPCHTVTASVP